MTPLLKNNILIYFILVNIIIALIYILTIILIVMSCRIKNKKLNILWPLSILKFCLPFFSVCFFGQSFLLLATIFDCQNGFAYVSKTLVCRTGTWFKFEAPLAGVGMVLQAILALITNTLYFKSIFVKHGSDVLKKNNCIPDVMLLITKIFIIVLFIFDDGNEDENWAVLIFLILITGVNTLCNYNYQNRLNKQLTFINNILCLMPFLGFFSLFVGKIFKSLGFNGSIFLFFTWVAFGILFILFYKNKEINFALINYKNIENPQDYLNYIHKYHSLVMNKNNSRNDFTILKSLIAKKEEKCFDVYCPLKIYADNPSDEIEDIFPLLQFCEKLFEFGISKFPNDISLKINYSLFLIFEMNHNNKALIILNSINSSIFAFQDNYNIYRCQRLIDEYLLNKNKNKNIINSFEYKKKVHDFKLLISKTTSLYYDFWTLIIINKLNVTNNFEDLNRIGSEIIKLNKNIDDEYESLIKIKSNNYDLINFYSNFTENVRNALGKSNDCKIKNKNSLSNNNSNSYEIEFENFDTNILREKDLFKYLILSGKKKNLADIIDLSLNLCPILGYNKIELIGKNINILIPEIFHNIHDKLLSNFNQKSKSSFYKELFRNDNYIPEYLEKTVYAISKSKFLIPIKLKAYFVQTEGNEFIYIVEVKKIKDYQKVLDNTNFENKLKCVILTDDNFYIQSFTPNCVYRLMLTDLYISSNLNIINYIKQLRNEYQKKINEIVKVISISSSMRNYSNRENSEGQTNRKIALDNIPYTEKKKIKKSLIESNYLEEKEITWKINTNDNNINKLSEHSIINPSIINKKDDNIYLNKDKDKDIFEKDFQMYVKRICICNELVGYYFFLYKESKEEIIDNNFISFNITEPIDQRRDSIIKQKNYKYLFQNNPNLHNKKSVKFEVLKESYDICKSPKNTVKFKNLRNRQFPSFKNMAYEAIESGKKNNENISSKNMSSKNVSSKFKTDINNEENEDKIIINEAFIPKCPFNFIYDINIRCYKPIYEAIKDSEPVFQDLLKLQASNIISNYKKFLTTKKEKNAYNKKSNDSNESEESENEDKESFSSAVSSDSQSPVEDSNKNTDNKENNKEIKITSKINANNKNVIEPKKNIYENDFLNNYYKVNISKIQFSIYDFKREMVVDSTTEKISKIEMALENSKNQTITIRNQNIIFSNMAEAKKKEKSNKNLIISQLKKENLNDEKIIENKIMEAVNRQDDEEKIVIINKYTIILMIVLIACSSLYLYFEISSYKDYKTILRIIKNIISINYCNKIGLYYIRELTLLNIPDTGIINGQYNVIPASNKTEYNNFIKEEILNLFIESQLAMTDFIGTTISISKKGDNILTQTKLLTKLINSDLKANIVKNNIVINIVQLNSIFYNLVSSTSPIEQNHDDLYNFVYNSLNNFGIAINILIDTYMKELDLKIDSYKLIFQIQIYIYLTIYIIFYIILLFLLSQVINKKKKYIKIFLSINFDFITQSIDKCEEFINKFKLSEDNKAQEEENEESYEEQDSLLSQEKFPNFNINLRRKSIKLSQKKNNDNYNRNKVKFKCTKNLIFKIFFGIFLLLVYLIDYLISILYFLNLNKKVLDISAFYYHLQHFHLNIIEYFNIYREYLFDNGSIILNEIPYKNLIIREKYIFGNWTDDVNNITSYINLLITNKYIKDKLNVSLCSFNVTDYFKTENDCFKEVGNSHEQDIYTFSYGFVDDIRIKKNIIRGLSESGMIIGNLTEYETETWHKKYFELFNNITKEDFSISIRFRLQLFNEKYYHSISNINFINIILPFFNQNRKIIFEYLTIAATNYIYYILFSVSIVGLLMIYFFYLIPKLRNLNRIIYETKNMLKIIPIHILMADINIKNLLHISLNKK